MRPPTREDFEARARSAWGANWFAALERATGWNRRTLSRMGRPKQPFDAHRLRALADAVSPDPEGAAVSSWAREQADALDEAGYVPPWRAKTAGETQTN